MTLQLNIVPRLVFIVLCCAVIELETAKILAVFPTPSISHQAVFHPIIKEMVRRGHEVVVITSDPAFSNSEAPKNLIEIDLHNMSYSYIADLLKKDPATLYNTGKLFEGLSKIFDTLLQTNEVKQLLQNESTKFDLLLVEALVRPAVCFSYFFKVPMIQISSYGVSHQNYRILGAPRHPFLHPSLRRKRLYNLSLWEKTIALYDNLQSDFKYIEDKDNEMLREHYGDDFPTLNDLYSNIDLLFLNEHAIWCDNCHDPPSIVRIWGIHQKLETEMSEDLKSYLDSSTQGIIYFSLGSNVKSFMFPPQKLKIMVKVLSELPYNVLWKWDLDKLPGEPKNIKLSKWFPQVDVFKHSNIKLFITQGGIQSTDEGIRAGVPFVGIPCLGDQFYNVEKYDKLKIGKFVRIKDITEESFRRAVETVIGDKSYKDNVMKLRAVMYDQPQTALERVVWWTEHVLRHGGAGHLRAPAANMHWTQYYEVQLIAELAAVACIVLTVLASFLRYIETRVTKAVHYILEICRRWYINSTVKIRQF